MDNGMKGAQISPNILNNEIKGIQQAGSLGQTVAQKITKHERIAAAVDRVEEVIAQLDRLVDRISPQPTEVSPSNSISSSPSMREVLDDYPDRLHNYIDRLTSQVREVESVLFGD